MTLKHLTDRCLLDDTQKLARREREILTLVLHHFRELERRRLFDGHSSLFEYATKACGYSEDQACRRIAAMRLLKTLPEIEAKIETGAITLTHVGLAQSFFKNEFSHGNVIPAEARLKVFEAIAGQTTREAQKRLVSFSSAPPVHRDAIRPLGGGENSASIKISDATLKKIERLKGLLAHRTTECSLGDLVDQMCDLALEQWSPAKTPARPRKRVTRADVRRQVWTRDGARCTKCKSTFAVQEDHITPASMGGEYSLTNIRLLCRTCNQRAAIEKLGLSKMERFLN